MLDLKVVLFTAATGLGHYGGFPRPPHILKYAVDNFSFLRWLLLFVLIWQGGASKSNTNFEHFFHSALLVTAFFLLRILFDTVFTPNKPL